MLMIKYTKNYRHVYEAETGNRYHQANYADYSLTRAKRT